AWRFVREERAQMPLADIALMALERLPRCARGQGRLVRHGSFLPSLRVAEPVCDFPQSKSAAKRVGVVAGPAAGRQRLEAVNVAASEDDLLGLDRRGQATDDVRDVTSPLRQPVRAQSAQTDVLLECPISVRQ